MKPKLKKKKLKQAKIAALLILIFCLLGGGTILYRTSLRKVDLTKIEGKLHKSYIEKGFGNLNRNYAILLDIENSSKTYGLYAGTKDQAESKYENLNLKEGELYQIYMNSSMLHDLDGINLGIKLIKSGNRTIYKQNMKPDTFFGLAFILLGTISSVGLYLFAKKKFSP